MKLKYFHWTVVGCLGLAACGGGQLTLPETAGSNAGCFEDGDCDSIANGADNCPEDYNPSQTDADQNGIGEVCEPFLPGGVECSLRSCVTSDDCNQYVRFCPGAEEELGLSPACCDGMCFNVEGSETLCPAGTCPDVAPVHCQNDEECGEGEVCAEGCCAEEALECACDCPMESSPEQCTPCPPEAGLCGG